MKIQIGQMDFPILVNFSSYPVLGLLGGIFLFFSSNFEYSKTCLKQQLKIDKTKVLKTNGSPMKVKSIAECSMLQYF